MGYYVVSSDTLTVIEFRDDHKILGVFDTGFDECLAVQRVSFSVF
jgi:hypothetical protein